MSDEYYRIVDHWYPEDFPFDLDGESIERLNSVVPGSWEYLINHHEDGAGVYLVEYVGDQVEL